MASAAAAAASTTYWCHECDMSINMAAPPAPNPNCPHCRNPLLQHMDSFPPIGLPQLDSIWASDNPTSLLNRPYLHRLIRHLTASAQPPAGDPGTGGVSRGVVEGLKKVGGELGEFCSICKDEFKGDGVIVANELPCGHVFHIGCIVPWLQINNSCPLCRFKLEGEGEEGEVEEGEVMGEEAYVGAMRLDELLDDGEDEGSYENEFRELMRIERGGGVMFSPTQIGEAGTGGVVDRENSVETVSSCPVWQAEGEREVGTSDAENVVRG